MISKETFTNRESYLWSISWWSGAISLFVTMVPELVPDKYEVTIVKFAAFLLAVGKLGMSPLKYEGDQK